MFDRMSNRARTAIEWATRLAEELGDDSVTAGHLAIVLVKDTGGDAWGVLRQLGVPIQELQTRIQHALRERPIGGAESDSSRPFSQDFKNAIESAAREAARFSHSYIGTSHLLLALAGESGSVSRILSDFEVDYESVLGRVRQPGDRDSAELREKLESMRCASCGTSESEIFRSIPAGRESWMTVCGACADRILSSWSQFLKDNFGIDLER